MIEPLMRRRGRWRDAIAIAHLRQKDLGAAECEIGAAR